jgi:hypothetical protein
MPEIPDHEHVGPRAGVRCAECRAPLAYDQRYCVECGTRRGGLPEAIAERIQALLARGDVEALAAGEPEVGAGAAAASGVAAASASSFWSRSMPSPRASAVAIMGMLAFGVVVGSIASTNADSLPTGPLVVLVSPPVTTVAPAPSVVPPAPAPAPAILSAGSSPSSTAGSSSTSGSSSSGSGSSSSSTPSTLPPVKHVFVIMLADQGYDQTFGAPTSDPYLATTLRKQGELLPNYYAVTQGELANEIALISGQGPTPQTAANCPNYADIEPAVAGTEGQVVGSGCVYPSSTQTLADQLISKGDTWKAYVEGIGDGPHGQAKTCRHPALGSADPGTVASLQDPYVTWRNPLVYFSAIGKTACSADDVGLNQLASDLKTAKTTPSFSYIVPSPCDDGDDQPCAPGAQSGLAAADRFLRGVVPEIEASPAYAAGGLIAITFDQAPQSGPDADSSSCCDNPTAYPNLPPTTTTTTTSTTPTTTTPAPATPAPTVTTTGTATAPYAIAPPTTPTTPTTTTPATTTTTPTTTTPASELTGQTTPTGGGGEVGLLLISKYVKANSTDALDYFNHFSLLSSIEQLFGLKRLGYATDDQLPSFGKPQYNNYAPG